MNSCEEDGGVCMWVKIKNSHRIHFSSLAWLENQILSTNHAILLQFFLKLFKYTTSVLHLQEVN